MPRTVYPAICLMCVIVSAVVFARHLDAWWAWPVFAATGIVAGASVGLWLRERTYYRRCR